MDAAGNRSESSFASLGCGLWPLARFLETLVEVCGTEKDVLQALLDLLGAEGLRAHGGVGVEGVDDGVDEGFFEIG